MTRKGKPYLRVREWCTDHGLPGEFLDRIPTTYISYSSTILLSFPKGLPDEYLSIMAEGWAKVLGKKTVLNRSGIISGKFREPQLDRLFGPGGDVVHLENGIRFQFDPERVMFSPGNHIERMRIGNIDMSNETVVDLFTGIGYFSLPASIHCRAHQIYSCEINPIAFGYLQKNIMKNHAESITPLLGDCREVAPEGVADRVFMGYMGTTHLFLETAFRSMKDTAILHYHENCPLNHFPEATIRRVEHGLKECDYEDMEFLRVEKVKSYGPKMLHVVADVRISKS